MQIQIFFCSLVYKEEKLLAETEEAKGETTIAKKKYKKGHILSSSREKGYHDSRGRRTKR
jgi:hypothetical protein